MTPTMRTTIVLMACIFSRRNHARSATRLFAAAFSPPLIITWRNTPSVRTGSSLTLRRHYPVGSAQPTSPHGRVVGGTNCLILRSISTIDSRNAACDGNATGIILDRRHDDDDVDDNVDDNNGGATPTRTGRWTTWQISTPITELAWPKTSGSRRAGCYGSPSKSFRGTNA